MTRGTTYRIGAEGEKRIKKTLEDVQDAEVEKGPHNGYPDLYLRIDGSVYGVECKTLTGLHSYGRFGHAKLNDTEILGLNELAKQDIEVIIIAEIRPKTNRQHTSYIVVPWHHVYRKWAKTQPSQISLPFWWLLHHGVNLRYFFGMEGS